MDMKAMDPVRPFWEKNREKLLYLFFGFLTTVVSILVFWLFNTPLGMNELLANALSWMIAVTFAFVTNRKWVFKPEGGDKTVQFFSFTAGRVATLLLEEAIIYVLATRAGIDPLAVKTASTVLVIILNYFISKVLVFKK